MSSVISFFIALGPSLLAGILAAEVAYLDFRNTHYPHVGFLLIRTRPMQKYAALYGIVGFFCHVYFDELLAMGSIKLEGVVLADPWLRSLAVGLSIKGMAQISLFRYSTEAGSVPVGPATVMKLIEPSQDAIVLDVNDGQQKYLAPFIDEYQNLDAVKQKIKASVPQKMSAAFRESLKMGADGADSVPRAMELALENLGRKNFERMFPLPATEAKPKSVFGRIKEQVRGWASDG